MYLKQIFTLGAACSSKTGETYALINTPTFCSFFSNSEIPNKSFLWNKLQKSHFCISSNSTKAQTWEEFVQQAPEALKTKIKRLWIEGYQDFQQLIEIDGISTLEQAGLTIFEISKIQRASYVYQYEQLKDQPPLDFSENLTLEQFKAYIVQQGYSLKLFTQMKSGSRYFLDQSKQEIETQYGPEGVTLFNNLNYYMCEQLKDIQPPLDFSRNLNKEQFKAYIAQQGYSPKLFGEMNSGVKYFLNQSKQTIETKYGSDGVDLFNDIKDLLDPLYIIQEYSKNIKDKTVILKNNAPDTVYQVPPQTEINIVNHFKERTKNMTLGINHKEDTTVGTITGMVGIGKTRTLLEIPKLLEPKIEEIFGDTPTIKMIYISADNGTKISNLEKYPEAAVSWRFLCSFFLGRNCWQDFFESLKSINWQDLTFKKTVDIISNKVIEETKNKNICLLFALDEFQNLDYKIQSKDPKLVSDPNNQKLPTLFSQTLMGKVISPIHDQTINILYKNDRKIHLYFYCCGLNFEDIRLTIGSQSSFLIENYTAPLIPFEKSLKSIFINDFKIPTLPSKFKIFLDDCLKYISVPRALFRYLKSPNLELAKKRALSDSSYFEPDYSLEWFEFMAKSILKFPQVDKDSYDAHTKCFEAEQKGFIVRNEDYFLFPHIQLITMPESEVTDETRPMLQQFFKINNLDNIREPLTFEQFGAHFQQLMVASAKLLKRNSNYKIDLKDLYNGCRIFNNEENLQIDLSSVQSSYYEANEYFIGASKLKISTLFNNTDLLNGQFVLTQPGETGIDAIQILGIPFFFQFKTTISYLQFSDIWMWIKGIFDKFDCSDFSKKIGLVIEIPNTVLTPDAETKLTENLESYQDLIVLIIDKKSNFYSMYNNFATQQFPRINYAPQVWLEKAMSPILDKDEKKKIFDLIVKKRQEKPFQDIETVQSTLSEHKKDLFFNRIIVN